MGWRLLRAGILIGLFSMLLAGCLGAGLGLDYRLDAEPCLDDTPRCVGERTRLLKAMLADPRHRWAQVNPSARTYASAVRLFAYRAALGKLNCRQLHHGIRETGAAERVLTASALPDVQVDRLAKIKALSEDVHKELRREFKRVCLSAKRARKAHAWRSP